MSLAEVNVYSGISTAVPISGKSKMVSRSLPLRQVVGFL